MSSIKELPPDYAHFSDVINAKKDDVFHLKICVQAIKNSFGLMDHWFYIVNDKEHHVGVYYKGSVLPLNTTKGFHVVTEKIICLKCYEKLINFVRYREDKRLFKFYPFINCETLTTGWSIQVVILFLLPLVAVVGFLGYVYWAIILFLCMFVLYLFASKYNFSRTNKSLCKHLKKKGIHYENM